MRIGFIGAGRIGSNLARRFVLAGHEVLLSFARDANELEEKARTLGPHASAGTPAQAAQFGDVVVLSVPWAAIGEALAQAGSLAGKLVIDTTNPFTDSGLAPTEGLTSAQFNQRRIPGARLVKSYNTLTSGFQATSAGRAGADRVVIFYVADDKDAGAIVARLIDESGFAPVSLGGLADSTPMEAPRRSGAVYGEEYHQAEAKAFADDWLRKRRQ
jgi:predicted dinucleotide-binding enzyme